MRNVNLSLIIFLDYIKVAGSHGNIHSEITPVQASGMNSFSIKRSFYITREM